MKIKKGVNEFWEELPEGKEIDEILKIAKREIKDTKVPEEKALIVSLSNHMLKEISEEIFRNARIKYRRSQDCNEE